MGDWLQDDRHDTVLGAHKRPIRIGKVFQFPPIEWGLSQTSLDLKFSPEPYPIQSIQLWPQPKPGEIIAVKFERRSGWRLAIQRPRLFWAYWRLMKFSVRSIKVAFRLAMV